MGGGGGGGYVGSLDDLEARMKESAVNQSHDADEELPPENPKDPKGKDEGKEDDK